VQPSGHSICSAEFEECSGAGGGLTACTVTAALTAANVCLASVDATNPALRSFGCRIAGACVPFDTPQSVAAPCILSSKPGASALFRCTGGWVEVKGAEQCDCAGKYFRNVVGTAGASVGLDFQRARSASRFSSTLANNVTFTDSGGNRWQLTAGSAAQPLSSSAPLSTQSAVISTLKVASICNLDRSICVADAASSTNSIATLNLCSSQVNPGELLVGWKFADVSSFSVGSLASLTFTYELSALPLYTLTPFQLEGRLRLLTPKAGWTTSTLNIATSLNISAGVGSPATGVTSVKPSSALQDALQIASVSGLVQINRNTPVKVNVQVTLPPSVAAMGLTAIQAALSLHVKALGCSTAALPSGGGSASIVDAAGSVVSSTAVFAPIDSTILWSCPSGYSLAGASATATCLSSALWSAPTPRCVQIRCGNIQPVLHGNFSVVFGTVGEITRFTCDRYFAMTTTSGTSPAEISLRCSEQGEWELQGGSTVYDGPARQLYAGCVPDVAAGACSPAAEQCTGVLTGPSCAATPSCLWCEEPYRESSDAQLLTAPRCQPATACYSTEGLMRLASCVSTFTPPVPLAVLDIETMRQYTPCNSTEQALIHRCSSLSIAECLTESACSVCPSAFASALLPNASHIQLDTSLLPVCTWTGVAQACLLRTNFTNSTVWLPNDVELSAVYGFHERSDPRCPAFVLFGWSLPQMVAPPPVNYSSFNFSDSRPSPSLLTTGEVCSDDCDWADEHLCLADGRNCTYCAATQQCTVPADCQNIDDRKWRYTCSLTTPAVTTMPLLQRELALGNVPSCSATIDTRLQTACERRGVRVCETLANCVICNGRCLYSPIHSLCVKSMSPDALEYTLLGHGRCAYTITNFTAKAEGKRIIVPVPVLPPNVPVFKAREDLPAFQEAPPAAVDNEVPIDSVDQEQCSEYQHMQCVTATSELSCTALGHSCTWCPANPFAVTQGAVSECKFTPDSNCQLNGKTFGRGCYPQCSTPELYCLFNTNKTQCDTSFAASRLAKRTNESLAPCNWCEETKQCFATQRCRFGSSWSYKCSDILTQTVDLALLDSAPACGAANLALIDRCSNMPATEFCNASPGCQLCQISDPFDATIKRVSCTYTPTTDEGACKAQGYLFGPGMCPAYTGQRCCCSVAASDLVHCACSSQL